MCPGSLLPGQGEWALRGVQLAQMGQFRLAGRANRRSQRSLWRSVMRFLLPRPASLARLWWAETALTEVRAFAACWLGILSRSVRGRRPASWEFNSRIVESDVDWLLGSWETEPLKGLRESGAIHQIRGYARCVADLFRSCARSVP